MKELIERLLAELGEDPRREGLEKTPERVEAALRFLTSGYHQDPKEILSGAVFLEDKYDEMLHGRGPRRYAKKIGRFRAAFVWYTRTGPAELIESSRRRA